MVKHQFSLLSVPRDLDELDALTVLSLAKLCVANLVPFAIENPRTACAGSCHQCRRDRWGLGSPRAYAVGGRRKGKCAYDQIWVTGRKKKKAMWRSGSGSGSGSFSESSGLVRMHVRMQHSNKNAKRALDRSLLEILE